MIMVKTIEEKLIFLRRIFEIIFPLGKDPIAIEILRAAFEILELRSDFSFIEVEYEKFLRRG